MLTPYRQRFGFGVIEQKCSIMATSSSQSTIESKGEVIREAPVARH